MKRTIVYPLIIYFIGAFIFNFNTKYWLGYGLMMFVVALLSYGLKTFHLMKDNIFKIERTNDIVSIFYYHHFQEKRFDASVKELKVTFPSSAVGIKFIEFSSNNQSIKQYKLLYWDDSNQNVYLGHLSKIGIKINR